VAAALSVDPGRWREQFDELMGRIAGRFARVEPRFRVDGAEHEIDLARQPPRRSAARSPRSRPCRHGRAGAAPPGRDRPQPAASAVRASGHGRTRRASRSAPAGTSPPASLSSTRPPPNDTDTRPDHGPASPAPLTPGPHGQPTASGRAALPPQAHSRKRTPGSAEKSSFQPATEILICLVKSWHSCPPSV
jgi:hypothetical protein